MKRRIVTYSAYIITLRLKAIVPLHRRRWTAWEHLCVGVGILEGRYISNLKF